MAKVIDFNERRRKKLGVPPASAKPVGGPPPIEGPYRPNNALDRALKAVRNRPEAGFRARVELFRSAFASDFRGRDLSVPFRPGGPTKPREPTEETSEKDLSRDS